MTAPKAAVAALAALCLAGCGASRHGGPTPASAATNARPKAPAPGRPITLQWVGDIALSSELGLPPGGVAGAFAPVAGTLRAADVTVGNLEGTLSVGGSSKCGSAGPGGDCFAFQAPPSAAKSLRAAGFDLVNQANNHSMDYGPSGRAQTVAALHAAHLPFTGFPGQITYLTVKGVRMAFLGFAPYDYDASLLDIPAADALIRRAARRASIVVVIIHAGAEGADQLHTPYGTQSFLGENRGDARGFARAAIVAGASIVLGSGPHVIRGVEDIDRHIAAYSLGNFVGFKTLSTGGVLDDSGILRVTLSPSGRLRAARWISVRLDQGLPHLDPSNASAHLVASLSAQDFRPDHFRMSGNGTFELSRRQ